MGLIGSLSLPPVFDVAPICETVTKANMRFVPTKAPERQSGPVRQRRSHASGATGHCDRRPFAPLPKRRQGRSKVCHEKLVAMIRAEEGKLLEQLGSIVHDLSRRISIRKRQW